VFPAWPHCSNFARIANIAQYSQPYPLSPALPIIPSIAHYPQHYPYSLLCVGEVFVLDDGGEVDLDLGNYERFLDVTLHHDNNITTGKIYQHVIQKERKGDYLGKTVQGVVMGVVMVED
jgi:hypothetical protein